MKAVFVIDVDKDELGKAFATITAEENDISFFARGVIRPLPQKMTMEKALKMERCGSIRDIYTTWDACLAEITGERE